MSPAGAELDPIIEECYSPRIRVQGLPEWAVDQAVKQDGDSEEEDDVGFMKVEYGVNWERSGLKQAEPTQEDFDARQQLLRSTKAVNLRKQFAQSGLQVLSSSQTFTFSRTLQGTTAARGTSKASSMNTFVPLPCFTTTTRTSVAATLRSESVSIRASSFREAVTIMTPATSNSTTPIWRSSST